MRVISKNIPMNIPTYTNPIAGLFNTINANMTEIIPMPILNAFD
jgi:hypothetical protein